MDAVFVDKLDSFSHISGSLDRQLLKQVITIYKSWQYLYENTFDLYRVFQKELYNFESL